MKTNILFTETEAQMILEMLQKDYSNRTENDNFMSCELSSSDYELLMTKLSDILDK